MKKKQRRKTEEQPKRPKPTRRRPTPRWLREQQDLDEMGRRRCLMILSVLSGEKAVSDAIAEAQISRQMYYQLEEKALAAMLRAVSPGATSEDAPPAGAVILGSAMFHSCWMQPCDALRAARYGSSKKKGGQLSGVWPGVTTPRGQKLRQPSST